MQSKKVRVMFLYWGRRGLSRLALDTARAALANTSLSTIISLDYRAPRRRGTPVEEGSTQRVVDLLW